MTPPRGLPAPATPGATLLLALPGLLALACVAVASVMPEARVATQAVAALGEMAPDWLLAAWVPWALVGGWRSRQWGPAAAFAVLGLVLMGRPLPLLGPVAAPPVDAVDVLVVNVNAFSDVQDPAALVAYIAARDPDVAVLLEKRGEAIPGMERVADNFEADLPRISHASAVFCRTGRDCPAVVTPEFGSETQKMPMVLVRLPEHRLCLLGAHAPPPVPFDPTGLRPHVEAVAARIDGGALAAAWGPCHAGDGVVLAGDLNATPRSPVVGLLRARGLRDALAGAGIFGASWPAGGGWPTLPAFHLDHLLVGRAHVARVRHARAPDTDHIGLSFTVWR